MPIELPNNVRWIINALEAEGFQAYIYGAAIRDALRGMNPIMWDITTNALPSDIIILFDDQKGCSAIPSLQDYGSVTLIVEAESYHVSTFRGLKHQFSDDIEEELIHNDFTINAMAFNDQHGLLDFFNARHDLTNRIICCTNDPVETILEDHSRVLRAVRFEAQLGFCMDEALQKAIIEKAGSLNFYDSEKACNEITQIMLSTKPSFGVKRLSQLGLLEKILPELLPTVGFDSRSSFHTHDVFGHTMEVLDSTIPDLTLRLAALLHDIDKPNCLTIDEEGEGHCYGHATGSSNIAREALRRLNFDSKTIDVVCALIKEHMNSYENATELSIKKLIRRVGPDNICNLFELQIADIKANPLSGKDLNRIGAIRNKCWELLSRREPLTTHDLKLTGYDLMPYYTSGRQIGEALEFLLDKVIDNPSLNERGKLLALLELNIPESNRN